MTARRAPLHAPLPTGERRIGAEKLAALATVRAARRSLNVTAPAPGGPIEIALSTISLRTNFDSYIEVGFSGLPSAACPTVDSGNDVLVMPSFADLAGSPNFTRDYTVLAYGQTEPFKYPANIVRGPIELTTRAGTPVVIPNCVFFACTDPRRQTSNFGIGCIDPPSPFNGHMIRSPLTYLPGYRFAELDFVPAASDPMNPTGPVAGDASSLMLHAAAPAGYRMMDILRNKPWMALTPKSLKIGQTLTDWPGAMDPAPIAMIDTGGGPVLLSDPAGLLRRLPWPDRVDNPSWIDRRSSLCKTTKAAVTIEIGDTSTNYTYEIDTSTLAPTVQNEVISRLPEVFLHGGSEWYEYWWNIVYIQPVTDRLRQGTGWTKTKAGHSSLIL